MVVEYWTILREKKMWKKTGTRQKQKFLQNLSVETSETEISVI